MNFSQTFRGFVLVLLVMVCGVLGGGAANAAIIPTWNVGTGQSQDNFVFNRWQFAFSGGALEFGQRVSYSGSVLEVPAVGNVYTAHVGHQTAGEFGATETSLVHNRWNFDYHIYYAGDFASLDYIKMFITNPFGNIVSATYFDMRHASNDNVNFPMGDANDPAHYIQDSQNPALPPWFTAPFDMDLVGEYTFTLMAAEGQNVVSQTMILHAVPAPGTAAVLGLLGAATLRRRRSL